MARFEFDAREYDRLIEAIKNYEGDAESIVNDALHNEGGALIEEEIMRLMPFSGRDWKGKKKAAKHAKSLQQFEGNLSVTIATKTAYNYLYFPDDGTNTQKHIGNQQFFKRGAENKQSEIVDRCIARLVNGFESAL